MHLHSFRLQEQLVAPEESCENQNTLRRSSFHIRRVACLLLKHASFILLFVRGEDAIRVLLSLHRVLSLRVSVGWSPRLQARLESVPRLLVDDATGLSGLGVSSRSCTPSRICLMVMPGFQASSSLRMLKHTVPDG